MREWRAQWGRLRGALLPKGNVTFLLPMGLAQSQHFSGLSWDRVDPGWAEQTQPSPLDSPIPLSSGLLNAAQGLFLIRQLLSLKTSQCCSAMNLLCDLEEFASLLRPQFLQL